MLRILRGAFGVRRLGAALVLPDQQAICKDSSKAAPSRRTPNAPRFAKGSSVLCARINKYPLTAVGGLEPGLLGSYKKSSAGVTGFRPGSRMCERGREGLASNKAFITTGRLVMRSAKQFLAILICVLMVLPPVAAQDSQSPAKISSDVTIIIERQQVRFTYHNPIEEMRLQVFNQSGEAVFDSGPVTVNELNWPLQNTNGESLASGLYAYRLSIKEMGSAKARERRGHFIVDRAQDRDGADKLWVTSQNDNGVGVDLTVSRDENAIVAGTTSASQRSVGQQGGSSNRSGEREVEPDTQSKTSTAAAPAGTIGRIAKFTSANDLGDSVITEQNGNIGIGIGALTPESPLHVHGANGIISSGSGAALFFRNRETNTSTDYWGWYSQNNIARFWRTGVGDLIGITPNGNVGIGTLNPTSKLEIVAQDGLALTGNNPYMTFRDSANGNKRSFVQGFDGGLIFTTNSFIGSAGTMVVKDNGNVGIGTSQPAAKLHVAGNYLRVNGAGNEQTYIGGDGIGNDAQLGSANPTVTDVVMWNSATNKHMKVVASAVTLMGGADFAEHFDVKAPQAAKIEAGMIVSIDPGAPGRLTLSAKAYDRRVAGVISGAGGVKPGVTMGQEGTLADGQHPVALSGRVYVWADASHGAIKPGDLLTTSPTPGHAMKAANPSKAQGAIIGKAMTELKRGKGLVLALVTLQ
jgi:hypothetical protein